jgi:hypothetical protein
VFCASGPSEPSALSLTHPGEMSSQNTVQRAQSKRQMTSVHAHSRAPQRSSTQLRNVWLAALLSVSDVNSHSTKIGIVEQFEVHTQRSYIHTHTHAYIHAHLHTHAYTHTSIHAHARMHTHTHTHIHTLTHSHMNARAYAYTHTRVCDLRTLLQSGQEIEFLVSWRKQC